MPANPARESCSWRELAETARIPANPLLADGLYLAKYIERMGTGTLDMIRRCAEVGLPEPEFDVDVDFIARIRRLSAESGSLRAR